MLLITRTTKLTILTVLSLFCLILTGHSSAVADNLGTGQANNEHVSARLIADTSAIQPGKTFHLAIELTMQPGWHTYYKEPGDVGMATKIDWIMPVGFLAKPFKWERPTRLDEAGIVSYVYSGTTIISAAITPPTRLALGSVIALAAKVRWVSCHDICVPGGTEIKLDLPVVSATSTKATSLNTEEFARANFDLPISELSKTAPTEKWGKSIRGEKLTIDNSNVHKPMGLQDYVILAFIGGLILNFMPCVLPVVAIKVLSLLEQAQRDSARVRILGIVFAAGIISSFLFLAALVIALQAAGHKIGWGFQFQYPPFIMAMATIVLLFALGLFGQLNLSFGLAEKECTRLSEKEGLLGTFFKGVLATILSTPCTAPFLGTAVGFAFVQPNSTILAIFFTVGLGMAAPYLLLTANPRWMKFLPKPGVWMEKLKELFGFVLLATVAWLLSIFGNQVGIDGSTRLLYFLLVVAAAVWLVSRFSNLSSTSQRRIVVKIIALAMTGLAFYFFILSEPNLFQEASQSTGHKDTSKISWQEGWQPFSLESLKNSISSGKTVFVDFSAKWCLTCQVNEATVLHSQEIEDKFKALHVVHYLADWTSQDASISNILRSFGRSGVPLYVIFPAHSPDRPIVLPEIINKSLVLQKLDEAGPSLNLDK